MSRKSAEDDRDYAASGMSIWQAMLDRGKKRARNERGPVTITWANRIVQTADVFKAPRRGSVRMECVHSAPSIRQGFDVKMKGGCVLENGEVVPVLRTWCDELYEPVIEYEYRADDGLISTWNVYETLRGSELTAEKWTGNAGFWVEALNSLDRIYHCSAGSLTVPDFDFLVYRITVTGAAD